MLLLLAYSKKEHALFKKIQLHYLIFSTLFFVTR